MTKSVSDISEIELPATRAARRRARPDGQARCTRRYRRDRRRERARRADTGGIQQRPKLCRGPNCRVPSGFRRSRGTAPNPTHGSKNRTVKPGQAVAVFPCATRSTGSMIRMAHSLATHTFSKRRTSRRIRVVGGVRLRFARNGRRRPAHVLSSAFDVVSRSPSCCTRSAGRLGFPGHFRRRRFQSPAAARMESDRIGCDLLPARATAAEALRAAWQTRLALPPSRPKKHGQAINGTEPSAFACPDYP